MSHRSLVSAIGRGWDSPCARTNPYVMDYVTTPFLCGSLIRYSMPVYPGAFLDYPVRPIQNGLRNYKTDLLGRLITNPSFTGHWQVAGLGAFENFVLTSHASRLSDYFIRLRQNVRRNRQADLLGCFQIDDELELGRLLDWKIGGFEADEHRAMTADQ